ncbi:MULTISPECIES: YtjB family periplasmic protein [Glaesserella]|uniref:Hemolysin regulation protein AhpA n=1 Tax=Glaesserella australis TaxID=2094024 RepID=A0A328BXB1_9PAST|nr:MULTISPECIES: YtjB family periplasmic protein [Glaesserella]AUI67130.1 hemolysin regulation protein AhpA [Glaesserella sp. 15-184]RAL18127.1 hemolysin regulation protein AhpA [Glaesserella australis]
MYISREKAVKSSVIALIIVLCLAVVGVILNGIGHFKVGSQLAGINQVTNLSHLLVRQQANLFSLMLVKNTKNEELIEALDAFAKEEFVIDANLYSASGSLIAQSRNAVEFNPKLNGENPETIKTTQQIVEPIFAKDDLIGFLRVTFDTQYGQTTQSKVNELFHLLYGELIILFLAGGLFVSCFFYFSGRDSAIAALPIKLATTTFKSQAQRFHSRRRAFRRK